MWPVFEKEATGVQGADRGLYTQIIPDESLDPLN
jgi:hypothetical protein